jgi:hypothetical protein
MSGQANEAPPPPAYRGVPIVVVDDPVVRVRLTWRQRLWSWPWRPWRRTELRQFRATTCPPPGVWLAYGGKLYMRRDDYEDWSIRRTTSAQAVAAAEWN